MFDDQIFFLTQYFVCKQTDIEWILNKMSKTCCLQISFHIRFSCKRSKRYVEFGIEKVIVYINEPHCLQKCPGEARVFLSGPWTVSASSQIIESP